MEDTLKELSDTTMNLATKKEIKEARKYVLREDWQYTFNWSTPWSIWCHKKSNATKQAMGTSNYPKVDDKTNNILDIFTKRNKTIYKKRIKIKLKKLRLHLLKQET